MPRRFHHRLAGQFLTLVLTLFAFTPLAQLFALSFFDWEFQYYVREQTPFWHLFLLLSMNAGGLLGFELTRQAWLKGGLKRARAVLALTLALIALYVMLFFRRVFWVGSLESWQLGEATLMPLHRPFMTLLAVSALYVALFLYVGLGKGAHFLNQSFSEQQEVSYES